MPRIQGFQDDGAEQYVYQESDTGTSAAIGVDSVLNTFNVSVLTVPGAHPSDFPVIQIYPAGDIVLIPVGLLSLIGDMTGTNDITLISTTASSSANSLILEKSRSGSAIVTGDALGNLLFSGHDGTDYITASQIKSVSSGTIGTNRVASNLLFYTHPDSTSASTLRMTIASTGALTLAAPDSGTALTISGGGLTSTGTTMLSSLSAGVMQTNSSGVVSSNNGTNGQLLIGGGSAPAWANITSSGSTVTITNGANSINLEASSSGGLAHTFHSDSGDATVSSGAITMAGGSNIGTTGSGSTVTYNLVNSPSVSGSLTAGTGLVATTGGLTVTAGSTTLTPLAAARAGIVKSSTTGVLSALIDSNTNGQVLISSSSGDPAWASLSAGSNITITPGSNSITIATTASPFAWTEVTGTSQSMAVNNGYILNNVSLVTATLPTTAAVGDVMSIVGKGAGGWLLAQNSSQLIHFSSATTTTGVGGSLASTNQYDCVDIICTVANSTWTVRHAVGNLTVV